MPTIQSILAAVRAGIQVATNIEEKRLLRRMRTSYRNPQTPQSLVDEIAEAFDYVRGVPSTFEVGPWDSSASIITSALPDLPWTAPGLDPAVREWRNILRDIIDGTTPAEEWLKLSAERIARTTNCDEELGVRKPFRRPSHPSVVAADAAELVLADPENHTIEELAIARQACDLWRELTS
ncbi:MAG: hypothetical protein GY906_23525 [bacterium]|nr:hypothetical protein [bacterium]